MTVSDYEIHIDKERFADLWRDNESETFPFEEDLDDIDRMIEEEIGSPKRRRRGKNTRLR